MLVSPIIQSLGDSRFGEIPARYRETEGLASMSHRRSPKVPTKDSFFNEGAEEYKGARWMARIQAATTTRAMELLVDDRIGGDIEEQEKHCNLVLDLGCGNGFSTEVIMDHGFFFVVGIDVSQDMLALRHLDNPVILADMSL